MGSSSSNESDEDDAVEATAVGASGTPSSPRDDSEAVEATTRGGAVPRCRVLSSPRAPWEEGASYPVSTGAGGAQLLSYESLPSNVDATAPVQLREAPGGKVDVERAAVDGSSLRFRGERATPAENDAALVFRDGAFLIVPITRFVRKIEPLSRAHSHHRPPQPKTQPKQAALPKRRTVAKPARPVAKPPTKIVYQRVDSGPQPADDLICRPKPRITLPDADPAA